MSTAEVLHKKPRVAFYTFGCRLNQAETNIMQQTFVEQGYPVVDYRQDPDVVVVNTCTVTENGDADTRKLVRRLVRENPGVQIALVGCQAQVQREKLLALPNVRWVVGNARKMDFVQILEEEYPAPRMITPTIGRQSFTLPAAGLSTSHTRANLKIQDGCDFFCSFCEIPFARGRARSREFADLLAEARQLADHGFKELVLTGINIGTYHFQGKTITDVIQALEAIPGIERIRISSIEPTTIPLDIVEKMRGGSKLVPHLHIPLQSGSNAILQKMKRLYTREEFAHFIQQVLTIVPDIALGTDVIVGFPGEGEEEFQQTYSFLKELPFAYFHVFSYSARDHAPSRKMVGEVAREEIQRRSRMLRELSARKRRLFHEQFIGKTVRVLFERQKKGMWEGLTDHYIRVKVPSNADLHNQLLPVKITVVTQNEVIGEVI